MSRALEASARGLLWLLLGGWLGSWALFAAGVAPTAFGALPAAEAGKVVGPVLAGLHWYGAAAGLALALLAGLLGRGALAAALPLLLAALCLYSELAVTGEIDALRGRAFGPAADTAAALRFGALHRRSVLIFSAVLGGALALLAVHVWADTRGLHPNGAKAAKNRAKPPKNA